MGNQTGKCVCINWTFWDWFIKSLLKSLILFQIAPTVLTKATVTKTLRPWDTMALCLETPAPPLETPWRRESRSLVAPRVEVPGDKMKTQKLWFLAVYRPLQTKSAIPHPITFQNMRFERRKKNWWTIPLTKLKKTLCTICEKFFHDYLISDKQRYVTGVTRMCP